MRWWAGLAATIAVAQGLLAAPAHAQQGRWTIAGTAATSSSGFDNPYELLGQPQVQALAERALQGPLGEQEIVLSLSGTGITLQHLIAADIVARDGRGYRLAFNVVTAADKRLIRSVANPAGRRLAEAIVAERPRLDALLSRYDLTGVDHDLLAMALIGCVMLDWDGLGVTAERGLRRRPERKPNGDAYLMTMMENTADTSVRGLYWGSHSGGTTDGSIRMTTFGDHENPQRMGFPDINGRVTANRLAVFMPPPIAGALADVLRDRMREHQENAARIMIALRDGPRTAEALAGLSPHGLADIRQTLQLLEAMRYVQRDGDRYGARIPVLTTARDRAMLAEFRALGRNIMSRWVAAEYETIRAQLSGLSAVRAGVSYDIVFTQIWHDLFGWANQHLANSGYLYNPYGPDAEFVSFAPFVWEASLDLDEGTGV